jgi:2-methylisocitrate lyase-like PEP mutase family enzyme
VHNCLFTVRGFEAAGVDRIMLEDQVSPKRCGYMEGKEVISAEEGVEKIRAAVEARRDPDFIIKARTDSMATHGVKEAIRRLNLYAEAGDDLLFADALLAKDDIALVTKEVSRPLSVNMGMRNALSVLKQSVEEGRVIERHDLAVSFAEINDLMGLGTIREMEQRFLTAQQLEAKYGLSPDFLGFLAGMR